MSTDDRDYDGCGLRCRPRNKPWGHTAVWGECAYAEKPERRISIGPRAFLATDGEMSVGYDTHTLTELADRIEKALRTVPITLGPNARAMLDRGEQVRLSGGEYSAMALAVAMDLAGEGGPS
jgi:hypothetical protein